MVLQIAHEGDEITITSKKDDRIEFGRCGNGIDRESHIPISLFGTARKDLQLFEPHFDTYLGQGLNKNRFVPLVRYLQNHAGCQVEVVSFGRSTSLKLKEACDDFLDLDLDPKRYLINFRGSSMRRGGNSRQVAASRQVPDETMGAPSDPSEIGRITGVE